jgi:hypothetical protein
VTSANKPSRREIAVTAFFPGIAFLAIFAFAFMAARPVKGAPKMVAVPGVGPQETIRTSPEIPLEPKINSVQDQASPSQTRQGDATQPTPENPITTLPQDREQPQPNDEDSSDNPQENGSSADDNASTTTGN